MLLEWGQKGQGQQCPILMMDLQEGDPQQNMTRHLHLEQLPIREFSFLLIRRGARWPWGSSFS